MVRQADELLRGAGAAATGDLIVVVAGTPPRGAGTNQLLVHRLGHDDVA